MKVKLICVGKTDAKYLKEGIAIYTKRLQHYLSFEMIEIPDVKNVKKMSNDQQKQLEGEKILNHIKNIDKVVILDEKGKEFTSEKFADFFEKLSIQGTRNLIFIIGGPYGFSKELYERADYKIALSQMTFSHQMVRLFTVEQIYRAQSIIKGEPYHHK